MRQQQTEIPSFGLFLFSSLLHNDVLIALQGKVTIKQQSHRSDHSKLSHGYLWFASILLSPPKAKNMHPSHNEPGKFSNLIAGSFWTNVS